MRAQDAGPDNSAPAVVKPVVVVPPAAPVAVKPVVVPPAAAATTLKDLPTEKPTSWKDIAQANGIDNPNRIMPGQVLKIPGRADYTVKPGDTLADIAAGKTKAPKYQPTTPTPGDTQPAAAAVLKKHPNIGTLAPIPRDVMKDLGMDAQTKKEIAKYGREELLTPAIIKKQNYDPSPAEALAALRATEKEMAAKAAAREANRKKVKEDEQTVPNEFKWGAPSWTARDGTVLAYDKKTNAYNMSSGPTKPDPNTMMSGIQTQRTTMKNGQPVNAFDRTFIAMNPATGTGHYTRSSQEGDNEPTQIHRRDVPADELAKLRADAGIPPRADDVDEGTFDDQTQVSSIERDSTSDTGGPADQHFSSTSFQTDPNDPNNNSYMDRQDHNGVASTTYARNVTPKWMDNLKATAGLPGAKPAAQPPSQYPTQAGQGMNNRPFAAYSTPPGEMEITRESLNRMRFLAGIHKK
jgi:LysM repeat protein